MPLADSMEGVSETPFAFGGESPAAPIPAKAPSVLDESPVLMLEEDVEEVSPPKPVPPVAPTRSAERKPEPLSPAPRVEAKVEPSPKPEAPAPAFVATEVAGQAVELLDDGTAR